MAAAVKAPQRVSEDPRAIEHVSGAPGVSFLGLDFSTPKLPYSGVASIGNRLPAEIAIGGHRGMGMNRRATGLNLCTGTFRENTVESLCAAAGNGAAFVEFDVQVTGDAVPVIWHDNYTIVRAADGECSRRMVKDLDLAAFKRLRQQHMVRECPGAAEPLGWQCAMEHELATLNEVFRGVPESVGFDIEVKMTTPHSALRTPPAEVERVTRAVLAEVQKWSRTSYRRMVFSTFDPDVAIALKREQSSIPVFFLSDGMTHFADARRCGHATAVAFAAAHGLDGVVLEISKLAEAPAAAADAAAAGLLLMTYGVGNNEAAAVGAQQRWGVAAAIVDDVRGVVGGLRSGSAATATGRQ